MAKTGGNGRQSTNIFALGMLGKQNKKGGAGGGAAEGRECKPWIARKELVGD